ncbi:hypothetical protein, partial [Humibacter sp.]|uniref:hypothetical protein n=1 Tax=Humibacter sp. TaxID=1940291 RepID=UPI003F82185E
MSETRCSRCGEPERNHGDGGTTFCPRYTPPDAIPALIDALVNAAQRYPRSGAVMTARSRLEAALHEASPADIEVLAIIPREDVERLADDLECSTAPIKNQAARMLRQLRRERDRFLSLCRAPAASPPAAEPRTPIYRCNTEGCSAGDCENCLAVAELRAALEAGEADTRSTAGMHTRCTAGMGRGKGKCPNAATHRVPLRQVMP